MHLKEIVGNTQKFTASENNYCFAEFSGLGQAYAKSSGKFRIKIQRMGYLTSRQTFKAFF